MPFKEGEEASKEEEEIGKKILKRHIKNYYKMFGGKNAASRLFLRMNSHS